MEAVPGRAIKPEGTDGVHSFYTPFPEDRTMPFEVLELTSPGPWRRAARTGLLTIVGAVAAVVPVSAEDVCDVQAPRVVAIGDIHGAYDNFVEVLRMAGLVDDHAHWIGGTTHLVQTGDFMDRGKDTRQVLDLLMRLEQEAERAGGRAHILLGNHEVMNMLGDLRYVNPEEYDSFRTEDSMRRLQRFYREAVDAARDHARARGQPFDAAAYRKKLEEQAPLGFVERTRALSEAGEYGRWLRGLNTVARVNGIVFLHGGLTPEVAELGCERINKKVHREITRDFDKTRRQPGTTLAAGASGPLWYRGLASEDEDTLAPELEGILKDMEARAIVVAHTVTKTGRIQSRFDGRVVMIDVGMSPAYRGALAALEIEGDGTIEALYPNARAVISMPPAGSASSDAARAGQP
jgi:hypothetical protein